MELCERLPLSKVYLKVASWYVITTHLNFFFKFPAWNLRVLYPNERNSGRSKINLTYFVSLFKKRHFKNEIRIHNWPRTLSPMRPPVNILSPRKGLPWRIRISIYKYLYDWELGEFMSTLPVSVFFFQKWKELESQFFWRLSSSAMLKYLFVQKALLSTMRDTTVKRNTALPSVVFSHAGPWFSQLENWQGVRNQRDVFVKHWLHVCSLTAAQYLKQ